LNSPSPSPLFRPEAIAAHTAQHLGSIRIGRNPRFSVVAWVALLVAAQLIAFAVWGEVTRKARVAGLLLPTQGSLSVAALAPGTLAELRVREGEQVQAGQVLAVIHTDRAGTAGNTGALVAQNLEQRQATLEAERGLREQQSRQRQQALADRIRSLQAEQVQADNEAALAERRVGLARKSAERYQQLAQEGFVAEVQAQQRQEELLDLQARADAARRNDGALAREQQSLRAEIAATLTQAQTEQAQLQRQQASLAQENTENQARQHLMVTAPQAGLVTALHSHLGASIATGQALATLVPQQPGQASELEAQLFAPSRTAGFVQPGQAVWLRYAAYPYQKFGMAPGQVIDVSRTPLNPQDLPPGQQQALQQAAQSNEPLYRIRVRLQRQDIHTYGQTQPLKPGMALEADVVQDKRFIWEFVLEPVLAARQHVKVLSADPNKARPGG
jgi:membrane fusion protein